MKPQLEIRNIHPVNFLCIDWDKHLENRKAITYEFALAKVCEKYQVTAEQIKGKERHAYIMDARQILQICIKIHFWLRLNAGCKAVGEVGTFKRHSFFTDNKEPLSNGETKV